MTRWLITGATGQLGTALQVQLGARDGDDVRAVGRADCDLADEAAVRGLLREADDDTVVLNAAAYTAVDAAETDEVTAHAVNALAPGWLAEEAAQRGARLIHVSTDYVFSGDAPLGVDGTPRGYDVDDPTGPISAYGRTKLAGEQAVLAAMPTAAVVRTAWVYAATGTNFVRTMLRLEGERETLDVVDDQTGNPTYAPDLAAGLSALADRMGDDDAPHGVLHAAGSGTATWCELARAVFAAAGADPERVRPTTSAAFVRPAPRPAWSVLSPLSWTSAGLDPLPPWRSSLDRCLGALRA